MGSLSPYSLGTLLCLNCSGVSCPAQKGRHKRGRPVVGRQSDFLLFGDDRQDWRPLKPLPFLLGAPRHGLPLSSSRNSIKNQAGKMPMTSRARQKLNGSSRVPQPSPLVTAVNSLSNGEDRSLGAATSVPDHGFQTHPFFSNGRMFLPGT